MGDTEKRYNAELITRLIYKFKFKTFLYRMYIYRFYFKKYF